MYRKHSLEFALVTRLLFNEKICISTMYVFFSMHIEMDHSLGRRLVYCLLHDNITTHNGYIGTVFIQGKRKKVVERHKEGGKRKWKLKVCFCWPSASKVILDKRAATGTKLCQKENLTSLCPKNYRRFCKVTFY